jgi:hypothetical protein
MSKFEANFCNSFKKMTVLLGVSLLSFRKDHRTKTFLGFARISLQESCVKLQGLKSKQSFFT